MAGKNIYFGQDYVDMTWNFSAFLTGSELSAAIRHVVRGPKLRCAVAFWGDGAVQALFDGEVPRDAQLICDISMGCTNPCELKALGAPENRNLKHLQGLHAKVYISDCGLVVSSANASSNGIGFLDAAGLVEAGSFHQVGSEAYDVAGEWFQSLFSEPEGSAVAIDEDVLKKAEENWRSRRAGGRRPTNRPFDENSLLDLILVSPGIFDGVSFVFTSSNSTIKDRDDAAGALIACDDRWRSPNVPDEFHRQLGEWPVQDVFSKWPQRDVSVWLENFVNIHKDRRGKMSYWFYHRTYAVPLNQEWSTVLATKAPNLRHKFKLHQSRQAAAQADTQRLKTIFDRIGPDGYRLFSRASDLAAFLHD